MQSRETQITMVKWTNAGGQTKRANCLPSTSMAAIKQQDLDTVIIVNVSTFTFIDLIGNTQVALFFAVLLLQKIRVRVDTNPNPNPKTAF